LNKSIPWQASVRIHAATEDLSLDVAGGSSGPVIGDYIAANFNNGAVLAIISDCHQDFYGNLRAKFPKSMSGKRAC
jgi:hypothetical protein